MNRGRHKKIKENYVEQAIEYMIHNKVGYFQIVVFNNDRNYPLVQTWRNFTSEDFAREWLEDISRKWDYVCIHKFVVLDNLTTFQKEKLGRYGINNQLCIPFNI